MTNDSYSIGNMAASTADDTLDWVSFDGGPVILLQAHAAELWCGTDGTNDEAAEESDYDFTCEFGLSPDPAASFVATRYDREMLVLDDSEWAARPFVLPTGEVGIVQVHCRIDDMPTRIVNMLAVPSDKTWPIEIIDDRLYLIAAVDDLEARIAPIVEIAIRPGRKNCELYMSEHFSMVFLREAAGS